MPRVYLSFKFHAVFFCSADSTKESTEHDITSLMPLAPSLTPPPFAVQIANAHSHTAKRDVFAEKFRVRWIAVASIKLYIFRMYVECVS